MRSWKTRCNARQLKHRQCADTRMGTLQPPVDRNCLGTTRQGRVNYLRPDGISSADHFAYSGGQPFSPNVRGPWLARYREWFKEVEARYHFASIDDLPRGIMKQHRCRSYRPVAPTLVATFLVLTALAGCGGGESTSTADSTVASTTQPGTSGSDDPPPTQKSATTTTTSAVMPDLLGLDEESARQQLLEDGVQVSNISTEPEPSFDDAGTVVDQNPAAGDRVSGSITLAIASSPGEVPDFVGKSASEARKWAEGLGIKVEESDVESTAEVDSVVASTPPAGAEATERLVIEIATKPAGEALSGLEAVADSCYGTTFGEATTNGQFLQDSIIQELSSSPGGSCLIEYDLGRDWKSLQGTLGLGDDSPASAKARFQVLRLDSGDPVELYNEVIGFGDSKALEVDVSDALRIRLVATNLVSVDDQPEAVWGTLRRVGRVGPPPPTTTELDE